MSKPAPGPDPSLPPLAKLQGWLEKIRKLDFYGAPRAAEAADRLKQCEAVLDDYARLVFDAHDENK